MRLENLETPALFVDMDAFEHNIRAMQGFADSIGVALRPHYKSHKCTAIARRQMQAGAKGITCAKLSEAEDLILAGIEDVLIANQIREASKLSRLAYLAGCCRLCVCVDEVENIRQLEAAAAWQGSVIHCLVEYDVGMRRCGVETAPDFVSLARLIETCPHLSFDGIQAYAGNIALESDGEKRQLIAGEVEARLRELIEYAQAQGLRIREVSGVSTGTAGFKRKGSVYTEMQAGSYIFMDSTYNALNVGFKNSLFVLCQVISVNSEWLIVDAGLKSLSTDHQPPLFAKYPDREIFFSEEHAQIRCAGLTEQPGARLAIIPGHCCTTVNLYDWLYLTRDHKVIDRVPVNSRGKSR